MDTYAGDFAALVEKLGRSTGMKVSVCVVLATSVPFASDTPAGESPLNQAFKVSRQDEDWSALRDPELRSNLFDSVKFISPLNGDGSSWLTLGGEARERYEKFENANWGKGPQDDDGYFLHRFLLHTDAHAGEFLHESPPGEDVNYFSTWITFRF
jgi:hypothetical protein